MKKKYSNMDDCCPIISNEKISVHSLFADFTIISDEHLKRSIEKRCMSEVGMAFIEKRPEDDFYLWHTLLIGGMSYKKDCASLFVKQRKASVYFIQAISGGLVKIGVSDNPETRLKSHQCGSPVQLRIVKTVDDVDRRAEAAIHHQFRKFRRHGEWFDPCVLGMEFSL